MALRNGDGVQTLPPLRIPSCDEVHDIVTNCVTTVATLSSMSRTAAIERTRSRPIFAARRRSLRLRLLRPLAAIAAVFAPVFAAFGDQWLAKLLGS